MRVSGSEHFADSDKLKLVAVLVWELLEPERAEEQCKSGLEQGLVSIEGQVPEHSSFALELEQGLSMFVPERELPEMGSIERQVLELSRFARERGLLELGSIEGQVLELSKFALVLMEDSKIGRAVQLLEREFYSFVAEERLAVKLKRVVGETRIGAGCCMSSGREYLGIVLVHWPELSGLRDGHRLFTSKFLLKQL